MYDLDIDGLVKRIKEKGHSRVLLQLADGLKPRAKEVVDRVESETDAEAIIWLGTCFGACDLPLGLAPLKIDMVVQWGHNRFLKKEGW